MVPQMPDVRCPECGGEGGPDTNNWNLCPACYRKLLHKWEEAWGVQPDHGNDMTPLRCPGCGGEGGPDTKNWNLCPACSRKLMNELEASERDA